MAIDYGIRISQLGQDVKTCPDNKLVFTSKMNTLKVVDSGVLSVVIPAGSDYSTGNFSVSYDHGLDYTPAFIVNPNDGTTAGTMTLFPYWAGMTANSPDMIDNLIFEATMSSTTLTCYVRAINGLTNNNTTNPFWPNASDKTVYFKYFLFSQALA